MAQQLRVHHLAKELGVSSKEIIAKCAAEGIELKNHMATISAGLAESIREWFSPGVDVTSIETAEPVDLQKVKKPPRAKKGMTTVAKTAAGAGETAVAVAEPPATATVEIPFLPAAPEVRPAEISVLPVPVAEPPPPIEELRPAAEATPVIERPAPAEVETKVASLEPPVMPEVSRPAARARPEPPPPKPVVPAGPQVVPAPAELRGPRVVRIEAPEPVRAPRPRPMPFIPSTPPPLREGEVPGRPRERVAEVEADRTPGRGKSPRRLGRSAEVVLEREREWRDQDVLERKERLASATGHGLRARKSAERRRQTTAAAAPAIEQREVELVVPATLKGFCAAVGVPYSTVSAKLLEHSGNLYRINDVIDAETAELLAMDLDVKLVVKRDLSALERLKQAYAAIEREHLQPRPPVVAMLGHVDHGKTSLLDAIRKTNVAAGEAGGITQHIGASRIDRGDWHVTFLDTPGHEAFTAMRARGANLTDVVVLVVAADDGVMPQTIEAIHHARAAGVPIVVALNKIDLPGINLDRLYGQLAEHDLTPTEWGGHTDVIKTSATTGTGIDELLAHLSTLSELLDLKADPSISPRATVIEAQMREGHGVVAQVLVREGTLRPGQIVVCGPACGRVRSLIDDRGQRLEAAGPGTPVEVLGLDELPSTGDELYAVRSVAEAKSIVAEARVERRVEALQAQRKPASLEELLAGRGEGETPELNVILRTDNQGSLEALLGKLQAIESDKVKVRVLHAAVGAISEADVHLARASRALVIGFWVTAEDGARQLAEQAGVEIRTYRVIYEVIDDVQKALRGLLAPEQKETLRGKAEVREIFNIARVGTVAGCLVVDGVIGRSNRARLVRDGRIVLPSAPIQSLRRFKEDAREVRAGLECGLKIEGYDDIKPGDVIEAFEVVEAPAEL